MSNKTTTLVSKSSGDFGGKSRNGCSHKSQKSHNIIPKKVLPSKKITPSCTESKSCPNGVGYTKKCVKINTNKTTKSESTVTKKDKNNVVDYCNKCGDNKSNRQSKEKISKIVNSMNAKSVKNDNSVKLVKKVSKPIQQYYKNEHFHSYPESVREPTSKKTNKSKSLDTIKEVSEMHTISEDSLFNIFSDSDEEEDEDETSSFDPSSDDNDTIKKIKEFRQKNYFECHSATSRIKNRVSATSLIDHKCVYRFYLNDRLFPVPLNTDYNNKIRCVECHLPMDLKRETAGDKINGTIQAKVKLGTEDTQDMLVLLPVKDSLIIEERRKEIRPKDDYVYFGVIKLSADGNSIFNKTLPENSFALKYQKGYQEHQDDGRFTYKKIKDDDVIVI